MPRKILGKSKTKTSNDPIANNTAPNELKIEAKVLSNSLDHWALDFLLSDFAVRLRQKKIFRQDEKAAWNDANLAKSSQIGAN